MTGVVTQTEPLLKHLNIDKEGRAKVRDTERFNKVQLEEKLVEADSITVNGRCITATPIGSPVLMQFSKGVEGDRISEIVTRVYKSKYGGDTAKIGYTYDYSSLISNIDCSALAVQFYKIE